MHRRTIGCSCRCTRRSALALAVTVVTGLATHARAAPPSEHREFVEAAFRMREEAIGAGDQAYGAVVVLRGRIVGYGPSRVVLRNDLNAHAEREAMRDAQARLGTTDLSGCVMYSTSRPCALCERAAAENNLARMYYGRDATDAGPPRR